MWLPSSHLAHNLASPCLGREPKVKVVTSIIIAYPWFWCVLCNLEKLSILRLYKRILFLYCKEIIILFVVLKRRWKPTNVTSIQNHLYNVSSPYGLHDVLIKFTQVDIFKCITWLNNLAKYSKKGVYWCGFVTTNVVFSWEDYVLWFSYILVLSFFWLDLQKFMRIVLFFFPIIFFLYKIFYIFISKSQQLLFQVNLNCE
jgi:hypothetical protein